MKRLFGSLFAAAAASLCLASCGGAGTSSAPGIPGTSSGSGTSGAATPTATPVAKSSGAPASPGASSAPGATATPTSKSSTSPTATPTATSTGGSTTSSLPAPTAPPDAPGHTNVVPGVPAGSACRPGTSYNIYVTSAPTDISTTGSLEAFTVFEPGTVCGNQKYPLILNAAGFGSSRTSAAGSFSSFTSAGYGVISLDQAGAGEDGGTIRVMDPDQEGRMYLAVMDWAQAKLAWLQFAPTLEGDDPSEPVMGSDGGSYGGMYQMMLVHIDKRHRLRAITPQITPGNLNFSLFQGGVIKTLWNAALFGIGNTAGSGTSRLHFDPYVTSVFVRDDVMNLEDAQAQDFFGYHSADIMCNGKTFATNGDATNPGNFSQLPPSTSAPKVNALVYIGVRDTLFNFNNGYENYKCLQTGGGDVRLLSYQTGHNAIGVVPDPYVTLYYPTNDDMDSRCGSQLSQADAELDWFNQYLKGQSGAANPIPKDPCISLSDGDAVTVPNVPKISDTSTVSQFKTFPVTLSLTSGLVDTTITQTLYTAPAGGALVLGIPHLDVALKEVAPIPNALPMAFVGLCVTHAATPGTDLVDNQVTPLRGSGTYDLDLVGGGIRLLQGDVLEFCGQGLNDQYAANGSINAAAPTVEPITVTGTVSIAILPSTPTI